MTMVKMNDDLSFPEFEKAYPQLVSAIAALSEESSFDPQEAMDFLEQGSIWVANLSGFRVSDALPGLFVIPEMNDDSEMSARILLTINLSTGRKVQINMGNPTCQATVFEASGPGLALLVMSVVGERGRSWIHVIHGP
jgi:hypothetical protein